jgi:8-oxo-dGTP diphosphatase
LHPPLIGGKILSYATSLVCPGCGKKIKDYRNPFPTVDIIIELADGIILIGRKNEPFGWALPGGFVDYGESLEDAAVREAREETSLDIFNLRLLGCYSDPRRDPRQHNISTVYVAEGNGTPRAGDDAASLAIFTLTALPSPLCFDHAKILADYTVKKKSGLI